MLGNGLAGLDTHTRALLVGIVKTQQELLTVQRDLLALQQAAKGVAVMPWCITCKPGDMLVFTGSMSDSTLRDATKRWRTPVVGPVHMVTLPVGTTVGVIRRSDAD